MAVKIRLSRQGRKNRPFYHIVVADSRSPRDGRRIERLGTYNPMVEPPQIELDGDRALYWLQQGAQPSPTAKSILSLRGVLLKKHLLEGVQKGAFNAEEAERRLAAWLEKKEQQLRDRAQAVEQKKHQTAKERLENEKKKNEARLEALRLKREEELKAQAKAAEAPAAEGEASESESAPAQE